MLTVTATPLLFNRDYNSLTLAGRVNAIAEARLLGREAVQSDLAGDGGLSPPTNRQGTSTSAAPMPPSSKASPSSTGLGLRI